MILSERQTKNQAWPPPPTWQAWGNGAGSNKTLLYKHLCFGYGFSTIGKNMTTMEEGRMYTLSVLPFHMTNRSAKYKPAFAARGVAPEVEALRVNIRRELLSLLNGEPVLTARLFGRTDINGKQPFFPYDMEKNWPGQSFKTTPKLLGPGEWFLAYPGATKQYYVVPVNPLVAVFVLARRGTLASAAVNELSPQDKPQHNMVTPMHARGHLAAVDPNLFHQVDISPLRERFPTLYQALCSPEKTGIQACLTTSLRLTPEDLAGLSISEDEAVRTQLALSKMFRVINAAKRTVTPEGILRIEKAPEYYPITPPRNREADGLQTIRPLSEMPGAWAAQRRRVDKIL